MQQWEYKILNSRKTSNIEYEMNVLGKQGWELVNVVCIGGSGVDYNFKRPINDSFTNNITSQSSQSAPVKEWKMEDIFPGIE